MNSLFNAGGLTKVEMFSRLLCFNVDGANTFRAVQDGDIVQIWDLHVPFLTWIHDMAHMNNLAIHIFFGLPTFKGPIIHLHIFMQNSKVPPRVH